MNHKRLCRVLRLLWFFHFHINLKETEPCAAGCLLPGGGALRQWCLAATGGMTQFMYFSQSKPKFLSPNTFSTMAEITPTTVSLWKYKIRQITNVLCAITPTANTCVTVCVITHTHMWRSLGHVSLAGQILWAGKAEKGEELRCYVTTFETTFQISALEPSFFQRRAEQLVLVLHQTQVLATGGP